MKAASTPAIPSAEEVARALAPLNLKQLEELAATSGVPFTTLYKIARGTTENPGIETVRKFWVHIAAAVLDEGRS